MFEGIFTGVLAQTIFVFVLIFAMVFGILQKSKILGEKSQQVNSLVALAIGLLVVSVGYALDLIVRLVPVLAIGLVLILIFLLFVSFFYQKEFSAPDWLKYVIMGLAFIAVVVVIMIFTGAFNIVSNWFTSDTSWAGNIVLILIVVIVFLIVFFAKGDGK